MFVNVENSKRYAVRSVSEFCFVYQALTLIAGEELAWEAGY
jgi:hypothetical protein